MVLNLYNWHMKRAGWSLFNINLAFESGRPMHPHYHGYSPIVDRFKIPSLSSQRNVKDAIFAFKLIHGGVDLL